MRSAIIGIFIAIIATGTLGQRPGTKSPSKPSAGVSKPRSSPTPVPEPAPDPAVVEDDRFDAAHAAMELSERVALLEKFVADYPQSSRLPEARESLMIARASLAEERLERGDVAGSVALLKLTVTESPEDTPDGLFDEVIMKIPGSLYFRGRREEAFELASFIERRFESSATRLAGLATFHMAIENGTDAVRLATRAIELDPGSSIAYQTLGAAHRLNFDLDAASSAFLKAYELDQTSISARRGLADINRAVGRSDQAAVLYRQILAANENDVTARAGLVLSLFESGKRPDAESELASALERNPKNLPLLAGVAYWLAVNKEGAKAIEYAQKAIALEPRYVWSHIALARGQIAEGKPVDAEKTLMSARKYGNFPTLDYEIAVARLSAGFFRDAAEGLERNFTFNNGEVRTRLGGRIERSSSDMADLIAAERQSSILAPRGADDRDLAERLRSLNLFLGSLRSDTVSPEEAAAAAEKFVEGTDPMRVHRALFAASLLLERKLAVEKAAEFVSSATGTTDSGLSVPNPSSAVLAAELYGARSLAESRGEFLLVPEVPRQTLTAILRGRVEELAGWALLEQGKPEEAAVRFRRAVSVLPENSAWWRAAKWRLGNSLALQGNEADALEQYIQGYDKERPDIVKYIVVEALYRKLNNGTDGLEARIGMNPLPQSVPAANLTTEATEISMQTQVALPAEDLPKPVEIGKEAENAETRSPEPAKPEPADSTKAAPTPEIVAAVKTEPVAQPIESPKVESSLEPVETPKAEPAPEPIRAPLIELEKRPEIRAVSVQLPEPVKPELESPKIEEVKVEEISTKETEPAKAPEVIAAKADTAQPEKPEEKIPAPVEPEPQSPPKEISVLPAVEPEQKPAAEQVELDKTDSPKVERTAAPPTKRFVVETTAEPAPKSTSQQRPGPDTARRSEKAPASLFEPIVISVPNAKQKAGEKPVEEPGPDARSTAEAKDARLDEPADQSPETDSRDDQTQRSRPRVVVSDSLPCRIGVSQENISLIAGGGTIGILVTVDEGTDINALKGVSSSAADIEVVRDTGIGGANGRAFFVLRSKSPNVGIYQVTFTAPCGKKKVIVQVR